MAGLAEQPRERNLRGLFFCVHSAVCPPFGFFPNGSERRAEVEVGDGAFWTGEPVGRADAEAEWNIEDAEIVDELSTGG